MSEQAVGECECCEAQDVLIQLYPNTRGFPPAPGMRSICGLCSGTMVSVWMEYSDQQEPGKLELGRTICFVGNQILKELRAIKERLEPPQ